MKTLHSIQRKPMNSSIPVRLVGPVLVALAGSLQALESDPDGFEAGSGNDIPVDARSIAAGWANFADEGSLAVGQGNAVVGLGLASGHYNSLLTTTSSAGIGEDNSLASSDSSAVIGVDNDLINQYGSVALGGTNTMPFSGEKAGQYNVLIGVGNLIDGQSSLAPNTVEGTVLIGVENQSVSTMAWALGKGNIAQTNTVTLGTYASEVSNASLIVGNGTSPSARSNGLVVMRDGSVSVPGGSLSVGGSPAVTSSSAPALFDAHLASEGYVKRGDVGLLAVGEMAIADELGSVAIGNSAETWGERSVALGSYSSTGTLAVEAVAVGGGRANADYSLATNYGEANGFLSFATHSAIADGTAAIALGGLNFVYGGANHAVGDGSIAIGGVANRSHGLASFAAGNCSTANSAYSFALGSMNLASAGDDSAWVETDCLFELGNGFDAFTNPPPSSARSNAITTLKNGRTTLTNKAWKAAVATDPEAALDDPASTTDSNGEALVVEGHTRLRGRVIIEQVQGDIPMFTGY